MTLRFLSALLVALVLAAPAYASQCPTLVQKIDEAVAAGTTLSAEDLAKVEALRNEGQALHDAGDHAGSEAKLGEAMTLLGM